MATPPGDIEVLVGLEPVRRRPGMYIGGTGSEGMHHMLWEVVGNAIDEHLRGGTRGYVRIRVAGHHVTVEDDGRGIPREDIVPIMTMLMAGPKYNAPHVHLGPCLFGIGIAPVCALSETFEVEVRRDGLAYAQRFARGRVVGDLVDLGPTDGSGTCVGFTPDFTILTPHPWDLAAIANRARELAALVPRLTFIVDDDAYCYPDGLLDYLRHTTRGRRTVEPIRARGERDGITVDAAIAWIDGDAELHGFVNCSRCPEGSHLEGLDAGVQRGLGRRLRRARDRAGAIRRGMVGVVHAMLADPRYGNPQKNWLQSPAVARVVAEVVERGIATADAPLLDAAIARLG